MVSYKQVIPVYNQNGLPGKAISAILFQKSRVDSEDEVEVIAKQKWPL